MYKKLLCIICIAQLFVLTGFSQEYQNIIEDPTISLRCKRLLEERNEKVFHQQKLKALLKRTKKLEKHSSQNRTSALKQIEITQTEIENDLRLTSMRIQSMEENIIRKGCPGIRL